MSKIKTARGRIVDLELEQMLTQIKKTPKTKEVVERENYVSERMRPRRARKPNLPKKEPVVDETTEEVNEESAETEETSKPAPKAKPKAKAKVTPRQRAPQKKEPVEEKDDGEKK